MSGGDHGTADDVATLADRVVVARRQSFVGRTESRAYFTRLLDDDRVKPVWFVWGIGGIGKTALARALLDYACTREVARAYVDARLIQACPEQARQALDRAMGGNVWHFAARRRVALLVIDSVECWQSLQPWLRDDFLFSAPVNLRTVLLGRSRPDLAWRTDPGWQAVMEITRLDRLSTDDCRDYLTRCGVPEARRSDIESFCRGHPLAMQLAVDAVRAGRDPFKFEHAAGDENAIPCLLSSFRAHAVTPAQHDALDACAVSGVLDEPLLAAMLGHDEAAGVFSWLRGQSVSCIDAQGVRLYPLVRDVLVRELRARAPGRAAAFAHARMDHAMRRVQGAAVPSWKAAYRDLADALCSLAALPEWAASVIGDGLAGLVFDQACAGERQRVLDMIRNREGQQSARWFAFWCERVPGAVYVLRDAQNMVRAAMLKLDMERLDPGDRDADPITRAYARFLSTGLSACPGDHLPLIRHWTCVDTASTVAPERIALIVALIAHSLCAANLRATAVACRQQEITPRIAAWLALRQVPDTATSVDIHYVDWQHDAPLPYGRELVTRWLAGAPDVVLEYTADEDEACAPAARFDRHSFAHAAEAAIKYYNRPDRLAENPLVRSGLVQAVQARGGESAGIALQQVIARAARALRSMPRGGRRRYEILRRSVFAADRNQKDAAASLNMGYSTYRRHLSEARRALVAELWRRERSASTRPSDPRPVWPVGRDGRA